jgi:tetratricopeptide (TPR) repeat protein
MDNDWLNFLYKYWLKGCEFYNKGDYDKAIEYFNLANKIFKDNAIEYDYYELREDAYKEILNNSIEEGIKKFIWFVEGILADGDYYNLSGELSTIASIFAKIGRLDIAKCFLNRGAEWIYEDIKNAKLEDILKSILTDAFSDYEREEILNKEPNLKGIFEGVICYFNLDFFDFMMSFFINAGNWKRFLEVYEEFKNKIKNCQISEETANKIIKRFEESVSDLLAIAYLLKGDYEKCLYYIELFKKSFNLDDFDEIYKEEVNFIENIANNLKNGVIKKEEWLNRLNEIYADVLNQPLPKSYEAAYHNGFLDGILTYCILKEFIEKL